MRMYLDAGVQMNATYAYYLSGTIAPLQVTDTYGSRYRGNRGSSKESDSAYENQSVRPQDTS
jgi:hypothetical protein